MYEMDYYKMLNVLKKRRSLEEIGEVFADMQKIAEIVADYLAYQIEGGRIVYVQEIKEEVEKARTFAELREFAKKYRETFTLPIEGLVYKTPRKEIGREFLPFFFSLEKEEKEEV